LTSQDGPFQKFNDAFFVFHVHTKPPMVLLSLTLTANTAPLPVFFDLPGRTHWRLLQYSVTGPAVAVELPWLGAQLRSVNPGIPVARAGVLQLQSGTFVCNWALGQCDRMPPQVLLLFQDALAGDVTVSFVFEVVQA
jgi:hypothetical protein